MHTKGERREEEREGEGKGRGWGERWGERARERRGEHTLREGDGEGLAETEKNAGAFGRNPGLEKASDLQENVNIEKQKQTSTLRPIYEHHKL